MANGKWRAFRKVVQRKKVFNSDQIEVSGLKRCLNRWDLTGLGLGSTLGVGIYVLVGSVALRVAGPSIVISFLIAAVASMFAGLCYAEFGSRVPKAGSAYVYTYVTVGEFAAFIVGWNMILEALFGTASVAKGLSTYIDCMANDTMSTWFTSVAPISAGFFSNYFDMFAFFIVLTLGVLLAIGARESSMVNNVFALLNMAVILFIIIVGAFKADTNNWTIPQAEVPDNFGVGGFFPYGIWGTLKGAALCFYGFVGFDVISATGEEVKEPRRTIPQAILTVLTIVLVVYIGVSTIVTMMVPYYLLDKVAAVATAFSYVGWHWARWVVSIGAVFGICASLFGSMFPLPRLLYSMSSDGLLHHWFACISSSRKTPIVATLVPACVIAVLAAVVDLDQLILMMCIGTLLSYTLVAICVIILRYRSKTETEIKNYVKQAMGLGTRTPSKYTSRVVAVALLLFICVCIVSALVGIHTQSPMIPVVVLHVIGIILLVIITLQPQAKEELSFKTPLVPLIPCLSIYVNIHMMILVNVQTWIRVIVWILIGIPIYIICLLCYKQNKNNLASNLQNFKHVEQNGKTLIQIVVETPTPPQTTLPERTKLETGETEAEKIDESVQREGNIVNHTVLIMKTDEIIVEEAIIENNEEKEAKIIDLLDQVLQAEEDSYIDQPPLKDEKAEEENIIMIPISDTIPHRKSLSDLSDAGSDASLGNQELSKYNVIAQVHREDMPQLREEEERVIEDFDNNNMNMEDEDEDATIVEDSETHSRTDESGYSDTLDRNALNDSLEDTTEDAPYIPPPPPMDENYFNSPFLFKKFYSIPAVVKHKPIEQEEPQKPRESVQSNNSQDDGTIVFGSSRQMKFMNKLNDIYQNKITEAPGVEHIMKRSNSTGSIMDSSVETSHPLMRERPSLFMDLKKEIQAYSAPHLRPTNADNDINTNTGTQDDDTDDSSMSKKDLRSKLEGIYGAGGPKKVKPKPKSDIPTPEDSYVTDASSNESIVKLPKMEKNDTLKRQKDKFGEVLNSLRLSLNRDDAV